MNTEHLLQQSGTSGQTGQHETPSSTGRIREAAQQAGQQIKQKASEAAGQLKNQGSDTLEQVRTQAREMAAERRDYLLNRLSHCSAASRRAAEQLRNDNDPALADCVETFASKIDRSSDYFRQRDFRGIIEDTENFARRRPEVFFGGLFVVGLALSRFLKASARPQVEHYEYDMDDEAHMEHHSDMVDLYSEAKAPEAGQEFKGSQTSPPMNPGGPGSVGAPIVGAVTPGTLAAPSTEPTQFPRQPGSAQGGGGCGCS
jgi:hypothetical protein